MLVQTAAAVDPATRSPIVVIDTTCLDGYPSDAIVENALAQFPPGELVLVFFASGTPKIPNISWLKRTHQLLTRDIKKRILRVYVVHETFLVRTVNKALGSIISPKFQRKLIRLKCLSELAKHIDISVLDISPQVYLDNLAYEKRIVVPKALDLMFGVPLSNKENRMWARCTRYLESFQRIPETTFAGSVLDPLVLILKDAFERGQYIVLDDYGPEIVAGVIKAFLCDLPDPLLPKSVLRKPLSNSRDQYTTVFYTLSQAAQTKFAELLTLLSKLSSRGLSMSAICPHMAPPLFGERRLCKDLAEVASRLLQNFIATWGSPLTLVSLPPPLPRRDPRLTLDSSLSSSPRDTFSAEFSPSRSLSSKDVSPVRHSACLRNSFPFKDTDSNSAAYSPKRSNTLRSRASSNPDHISDSELNELARVTLSSPRPLRELPPDNTLPRTLMPKASMRNIRGQKVAEIAQKYEPYILDPTSYETE